MSHHPKPGWAYFLALLWDKDHTDSSSVYCSAANFLILDKRAFFQRLYCSANFWWLPQPCSGETLGTVKQEPVIAHLEATTNCPCEETISLQIEPCHSQLLSLWVLIMASYLNHLVFFAVSWCIYLFFLSDNHLGFLLLLIYRGGWLLSSSWSLSSLWYP